jgi:surface carbohydrate biosynthesis protein (TIGR04326 family)
LTKNRTHISLTLWDSQNDPPEYEGRVYLWNGYAEKDSIYSLFRYVETHGERLRCKYLAWVHDLGEIQVDGKRVIDHLALADGLSYWWMTLFVEKSPWKSPSIIDAIRLFALEEIIVQQKPDKLKLVSANRNLHNTLNSLCENLDIMYEWEKLPNSSSQKLSLGCFYRVLPHPVQALIGLVRHIWARWPLRKAEKAGWFSGDKSLFLCSYFFHMNFSLAEEGSFYSHYWEGLHDLMRKQGVSGNWLQHYYPHDAVPNPRVAMDLVQRFNQKRKEQGYHTFLDAYLSLGVVLRVFKGWLKLTRISLGLGKIKLAFRPHGSQLSLWPLMREDWHTSLCGRVAIDNLLWLELFSRALNDLPHQKMGLYLCENQSWERALIHAWRKHGHGQLIAVPHSTMRFWDVRYFNDLRTAQSPGLSPMPQADLTALNGKAAVNACLSVGFPKKDIVECEALRYGYLNKVKAGSRKDKGKESIKVLILGDYMPSCTIKMLQLLEAALPHMTVSAMYTMKPHPNYRVNPEAYPSLNLEVVMDHLGKTLYDFDVVYSANRTSAAVDAYIAGIPVVVMLDDAELNFSPLRGQSDVRFVCAPEELAAVMQTASQNRARKPEGGDFFFLDPELPRWKKMLSSANAT